MKYLDSILTTIVFVYLSGLTTVVLINDFSYQVLFALITFVSSSIYFFTQTIKKEDKKSTKVELFPGELELRIEALESRVFTPNISEHLQKVIDLTDTPDYLKQVLYTRQDLINYGDQCIQTYKEKKAVKFFHEVSIFDQAKREAI